jgi:thiamine-monophosphate kinase
MPYKAIKEIGEFGLIGKISEIADPTLKATPDLLYGIGDDCAVYKVSDTLFQVATTDILVDQIHFDLLTTPIKHLGSKAISVNVSDICAMNALPRYALISLAIPPAFTVEMIEELYRGMQHAALQYGMAIAGGDTSSSRSGLIISVALVGDVPPERVTLRKGAKPGDLVCVSGALGGAAAGLRLLMREKEIMLEHIENNEPYNRNVMADLQEYREAIQRQLLPLARLDTVRFLDINGIIPSSMIDISDGLSPDLRHICSQSGTGALIHENRIPIHAETRTIADEMQQDALTWALTGGEDYELLFTVSKNFSGLIDDSMDISIIGEITEPEAGIRITDIYGMTIDLTSISGFDHFQT